MLFVLIDRGGYATGFVAIGVQNSDNKMRNYALFHFDIILLYQQVAY